MNLLADISQSLGKQLFYLRMDIFHSVLNFKFASLYLIGYLLQTGEQYLEFFGREQTDGFKHADVCHRCFHVEACNLHVELAVVANGELFYPRIYVVAFIPKFHKS